ncbi:MAG TPA: VOC family protein [Patescibacteria group bacterium]|nr:VOC family protein [Patescibacteria group bacterium]
MNNPLYFEIQADDIDVLVNFYSSVFDWQFVKQNGLPIDYYSIKTEGIDGGLLKRPAAKPKEQSGTNAAVISMEVSDYDKTDKIILNKGGKVALPKFAVPGKCWQGYYLDPSGNTFGIFQVDLSVRA